MGSYQSSRDADGCEAWWMDLLVYNSHEALERGDGPMAGLQNLVLALDGRMDRPVVALPTKLLKNRPSEHRIELEVINEKGVVLVGPDVFAPLLVGCCVETFQEVLYETIGTILSRKAASEDLSVYKCREAFEHDQPMDRRANVFLALGGKLDQPVVLAVPSAFLKRRPTERIISYQVASEDGVCLVKFCGKLPVGICVDTLRCKALQDIADMLSRPATRKSLSVYENRRVFLGCGEPLGPDSIVVVADDTLQKDNLFVVVEKSVLVPTTSPHANAQ